MFNFIVATPTPSHHATQQPETKPDHEADPVTNFQVF
jgi:hypothetical protein